MAVLTIILVAVFVAAWKAPAWVKELGLMGLVFGVFSMAVGLAVVFDALQSAGSIPTSVLAGGLKVALIPVIYGMVIFFISLIIRIVQKPRI